MYDTFGQTVSTAITFSHVQKLKSKTAMVPTLNVWPEGFYVLIYDCESDVLLYSLRMTWSFHSIVYLWVILHHSLFLNHMPNPDQDYSCGYLKIARREKCGFPFVDNLLDHKHINNPNFRVESKGEKIINADSYVMLESTCPIAS